VQGWVQPLAQTRQVIAVEMQGHGHTADSDRPMTFATMGDDIAALLDYLKIPKADLVGHSFGGASAIRAAIQHPDHVRRLVVISSPHARSAWYPETQEGMSHVGASMAENMIGLRPADGRRYRRVVIIEHFTGQKYSPLDGIQTLQQHKECHGDRLARPHRARGIARRIGHDRFGQPLADVFLALHTSGLQVIDAQPADDRDEERLGRSNLVARRLLPANECILQHVFRVGDGSQHPVSDREEQAPVLVERRQRIRSPLRVAVVSHVIVSHSVTTAERLAL
jgi:pimeloyl-ACP methyl ester carboxylesterase